MSSNVSQEDRLSTLAERARETLIRSGNCAQSSFAVLQEEFELDGGGILRALTPFPGMALRGETCGAVVGSIMALGLLYGRDDLEDMRGFIGSLPSARRFCRRFEERNGGTACATVLKSRMGRAYDLADSAESAEYLEAGGAQVCAEVVAGAVTAAAEVILRKG
jgi:C_GCAxxG_C_C family probable redox protein